MISKDTAMCISIAESPSNIGTTLHNLAYKDQNIDFIYKAFKVTDLKNAIAGVRGLNIRGCSVSMPYKQRVIEHLDALDTTAELSQAVNTIVNENGKLIGYNTDIIGAQKVLKSIPDIGNHEVVIFGAGGVARAIIVALKIIAVENIFIAARNTKKALQLADEFNVVALDQNEVDGSGAQVLINATPLGMEGYPNEEIFSDNAIINAMTVMDVVIKPLKTPLNYRTVKLGTNFKPGLEMAMEQMIAQYCLYTGVEPPRGLIKRALLAE